MVPDNGVRAPGSGSEEVAHLATHRIASRYGSKIDVVVDERQPGGRVVVRSRRGEDHAPARSTSISTRIWARSRVVAGPGDRADRLGLDRTFTKTTMDSETGTGAIDAGSLEASLRGSDRELRKDADPAGQGRAGRSTEGPGVTGDASEMDEDMGPGQEVADLASAERSPGGDDEASAPTSADPPSVAVPDIEAGISRLLRAYADAVRFAEGLPLLGTCRGIGEDGKVRIRWVSRPFTLMYVQSHARTQVRHAGRAVDLELLAHDDAEERERLSALSGRLKDHDSGVFGRGRLRELAARLPPVAAAIPILAGALTAFVQGQEVDTRGVLRAVAILSITGFLVWLLFVWPSIRLGFRVKRAIFSGGRDLRHPLWYNPGELQWQDRPRTRLFEDVELVRWPDQVSYVPDRPWKALLTASNPLRWMATMREPTGWLAFPTEDIYDVEGEVFGLFHESRPREFPVDLLLSPPFYLLLLLDVLFWGEVLDSVRSGQWSELGSGGPVTLVLTVVLLAVILQAIRNYRARSSRAPENWVYLIPRAYQRGKHRELVALASLRVRDPEEVMEQIARAAHEHPEDFPPDLMHDLGIEEDGSSRSRPRHIS